jgi:hypothetical protein
MHTNESRGQESPERQTQRLRTDGGDDEIEPPESELLGADRLHLHQSAADARSPLVRFAPDRGEGHSRLAIGYGDDAEENRDGGVLIGLDYETDNASLSVDGCLSPQQAREVAVALETFADAVEDGGPA